MWWCWRELRWSGSGRCEGVVRALVGRDASRGVLARSEGTWESVT